MLPGVTRRQNGAVWLSLVWSLVAGCSGVTARVPKIRNAWHDFQERREADQPPGLPSATVLERKQLTDLANRDVAVAATQLEAKLATEPDADGALALAELSYRAGIERQYKQPLEAICWYRDASALAALSLRESGGLRPDRAIEVHNRAVARLVRIAQDESKRTGGEWRQVLETQGIALTSPTPDLAPDRFADLLVIDDLRVEGMQHIYRKEGLGVPLVVHRRVEPESPDPLDRFHPRELRSAATAVVTPVGGLTDRAWRHDPISLAFFDPFLDQTIRLGDRTLPLAGDRTTPRVMQVAEGTMPTLELTGLFDSDFRRQGVEAGLYLLRPYEPSKIPVVLVHGLFSSPHSFLQNMNELENDPEIAARYQFWVFLYPTGLPIPSSALHLRNALNNVRNTLDPEHDDQVFDRMVLVGHSMGGLLSKMMVQNTGLTLWNAAFSRPVGELQASPQTRALLVNSLIFRPVPFVSRVVFVATPHRGSPIADQVVGRTIASFVKRTSEMAALSQELVELNGPDLIAPEFRRVPFNAVSNLRTDSPILKALDQIPISSKVPYHSIIPQLGGTLATDGVVEYRSSHLDGVVSETIVSGSHFAMQQPNVTAEVKRILHLHMDQY